MDACPTGALEKPFKLDPSKCLSYLTIEERYEIPAELIDKFHCRIYGCDICQDVCPFNKNAVPHAIEEFIPMPELKSYRKNEWLHLTNDQFDLLFKDSAIYRIGYDRFMKNIHYAAKPH